MMFVCAMKFLEKTEVGKVDMNDGPYDVLCRGLKLKHCLKKPFPLQKRKKLIVAGEGMPF